MSFLELLRIEFMKVKRSKIVPLIFIAPLLVVASGVASLSRYFTPEYPVCEHIAESSSEYPQHLEEQARILYNRGRRDTSSAGKELRIV